MSFLTTSPVSFPLPPPENLARVASILHSRRKGTSCLGHVARYKLSRVALGTRMAFLRLQLLRARAIEHKNTLFFGQILRKKVLFLVFNKALVMQIYIQR